MKKQKIQDIPNKDQQRNKYQKTINALYVFFIGQDDIHPTINRSIISNSYYQIIEVIHEVLAASIFMGTNNHFYTMIQSIFSVLLFLICIIPRVSKKYTTLRILLIIFIAISLGSTSAIFILIQNYASFIFLCGTIQSYHIKYKSLFQAEKICNQVKVIYIIQISIETIILLFRIFYIILIIKAYITSKIIHDEEEKRKRRKDRYDEIILNRNIYTEKRKV